jgi:hypothetical protein
MTGRPRIGKERSMSAEIMATTYARPRAPRAAVVATIVAAIFALGLVSGVLVSPALPAISQPVSAVATIVTPGAAAEAHLAWLQGEHDSYPASTTVSAAAAAAAHLAWLQGEHDSYPASTIGQSSDYQSWLAYRQFRLDEEGYGK